METGINHELDLLAEALHASVSLDGTDGRVLGYSVQAEDADPTRVAAILTRQVPADVSARQRRYGVDQATDPVLLLTTLEICLDLAGDAQRTATALHLHRTPLYYRVNRAPELLQLDLTDGMTRTQLHLALKHLRLQRGSAG